MTRYCVPRALFMLKNAFPTRVRFRLGDFADRCTGGFRFRMILLILTWGIVRLISGLAPGHILVFPVACLYIKAPPAIVISTVF